MSITHVCFLVECFWLVLRTGGINFFPHAISDIKVLLALSHARNHFFAVITVLLVFSLVLTEKVTMGIIVAYAFAVFWELFGFPTLFTPFDDPINLISREEAEKSPLVRAALATDDKVFVVRYKGVIRVYLQEIIGIGHVINDTITVDGKAIHYAVAYCGICNAKSVFARPLDTKGKPRQIGIAVPVYLDNLILTDGTGTLFSQATGESFWPSNDKRLSLVPGLQLNVMKWSQCLMFFDDFEVHEASFTGRRQFGYRFLGTFLRKLRDQKSCVLLLPPTFFRPELARKECVMGIAPLPEDAANYNPVPSVAIPVHHSTFREGVSLNDIVGDIPYYAFHDRKTGLFGAFRRPVYHGAVLSFAWRPPKKAAKGTAAPTSLHLAATCTTSDGKELEYVWDHMGSCVTLHEDQEELVSLYVTFDMFWFAWLRLFPATSLPRLDDSPAVPRFQIRQKDTYALATKMP